MSTIDSYFSETALAQYQANVTDRRRVALDGIWMVEVDQPAGDYPDPPIPELVVYHDLGHMRGRCDFGAGPFTVRPGQVGVVAPMTATSIVCDNRTQVRVLAIPASRIAAWVQNDLNCDAVDLGSLHAGGFNNVLVERLLGGLWSQAATGYSDGQLLADAAVLTLWGELLRQARTPVPKAARGGLAPWQVRRCIEYLNSCANENVGLEQLATLVGLSPFHFARAFKLSTGVPPYRYQLSVRIEKAKTLLEDTDASITDIALDVGYESSQALARLFRREVGVSPSDYRRQRAR